MKSMTGYGRAEGAVSGQSVSVEVRCLNHRFRDIRLGMPRQWLALEVEVERGIRDRVGRGRVECQIRSAAGAAEPGVPTLNPVRMKQVYEAHLQICELLGLDDKPGLEAIARADGVIICAAEATDPDAVREELLPLVFEALSGSEEMRRAEGARLEEVIAGHLEALADLLREISAALPAEQKALHERTAERIRGLAGQAEVSEERLAQELAVLAERSDVTEEMSRLDSHMVQFHELVGRDGPVGRELDFLLQEMNREVNTLCSKFHSAQVVRQAVAAKAELEKIREQIQNVE